MPTLRDEHESHVLVRGRDHFQLNDIYVASADVPQTVASLRERVENARRIGAIADAIRSRQYIFRVLVESFVFSPLAFSFC